MIIGPIVLYALSWFIEKKIDKIIANCLLFKIFFVGSILVMNVILGNRAIKILEIKDNFVDY